MKSSTSTSTSTSYSLRRGFSLVELLVVIGILGILMGILLVSTSGSGDSAKAAKCMANMKNLATAVQAYGLANGNFPHAGSIEFMTMNIDQGKRNSRLQFNERKGWISWESENHYPTQSKGGCAEISFMSDDEDLGRYAVTNGALFRYVGDTSVYLCPVHANKEKTAKWSYLMNAYFGWNSSEGYAYTLEYSYGHEYTKLRDTDKILLFAELPFQGAGDWFPSGGGASMDTDCILQYKGCNHGGAVSGPKCRDGNEHIGANHKVGKNWFAHVVFADGHSEKFNCSLSKGEKLGSNELRELTTWLCTGKNVTFTGKKYEELK